MMQTDSSNGRYSAAILLSLSLCFLFFSLFSSCSSKPVHMEDPGPPALVTPAGPEPDSLKPGLMVYYRQGLWRNVNQMPGVTEFVEKGIPGKPILRIDHRFKNNTVFDSGLNIGVGVQMMGFLYLPAAGEWQFKAQSNDGVEVFIDKVRVVSDPEGHSDQFSTPLGLQAEKPGWYEILLRYFQRKGTATLELYWKQPGESEFTIIPDKAYWHVPAS